MQKWKWLVCIIVLMILPGQSVFGRVINDNITFAVQGTEDINEGDSGQHTFTITKTGSAVSGSVDYEIIEPLLIPFATVGQDFIITGGTSGATGMSGTIEFTDTETEKTITVQILEDALDEPYEGFRVKLSNPKSSVDARIGFLKGSATKRIIDNDAEPSASWMLQGSTITEDGGKAEITVTLDAPSGRKIGILLTLLKSNADFNVDYTVSHLPLGILAFQPGETSKSITFTAIPDLVDDDHEMIVVTYVGDLHVQAPANKEMTIIIEQQDPPTLTRIPDVNLVEDQTSPKIAFQIGDDEDPVSSLRVFGRAEDNTLIPDENFKLYGTGKDRSFRIKPAANKTGRTKGWIMVYDGLFWTSESFIITVTEANDPPGPGVEPKDVVFYEDESDSTVLSQYITDPDNEPWELKWSVRVEQGVEKSSESVKAAHLNTLSAAYNSHYIIFSENAPVSSTLKDTSLADNWVIIPEGDVPLSNDDPDTLIIENLDEVNGLFVSIVRATTMTHFFGSPDFNDSEIPLLFTGSDPSGGSYSFSMIVTIIPVNDAPEFETPMPVTVMQDAETLRLDWGLLSKVHDVDNSDADLAFSVVSTAHIIATMQADTLILMTQGGWSGTDSVRVVVTDGALSDTAYCEVSVIGTASSDQVTGIDRQGIVPQEYMLCENYPNPFNPSTSITYALPEQAIVTISVFNAVGQCVDVLVNETRQAGYYTVEWNAGSNSSGIYFFQIQTEKFQAMQRCILLK